MHLKRNKRIFFLLFLFLIFSTISNKYVNKSKFLSLDEINVNGLNKIYNLKISKELEVIKLRNLFLLDANLIDKVLEPYNIIENYFVFKHYPSSINIKLNQTNFLAIIKKNNKKFYIGSNGKLIEEVNEEKNLPQLFGNFEMIEFLRLKKIIDDSNFDYFKIKDIFFFKSKRWDIETRDGVFIRLPVEYSTKTLNFINEIIKDKNFKDTKYIDIRQKSQVIIK